MKPTALALTVVAIGHAFFPFTVGSQEAAERPANIALDECELTVRVSGIKHENGQLMVAVFSDEVGFPVDLKKAVSVAKALPSEPDFVFKGLPAGDYAVVVVHDRNRNNLIDRNLVGMPTEPVGLSNYKTIGLTNRPAFSKAKFSVRKNEVLSVKLISL